MLCNIYQDQCWAGSANQTQHMENLQYQISLTSQSSGYHQVVQIGSTFPDLPYHRWFPISPSHQKVTFNLPSEHVDKDSITWQRRQYQSFSKITPTRPTDCNVHNSSNSDRSHVYKQDHAYIAEEYFLIAKEWTRTLRKTPRGAVEFFNQMLEANLIQDDRYYCASNMFPANIQEPSIHTPPKKFSGFLTPRERISISGLC